MNKLEALLEDIKELSCIDNIGDAHEMQDNLEKIYEMVEEFQDEIFSTEFEDFEE
jgi:hypothetical protein